MMQYPILRKKFHTLFLLFLSALLVAGLSLSVTSSAKASGGSQEGTVWNLNANGDVGSLFLSTPWFGGANDVPFSMGSVFGQGVQSQSEKLPDGTTRIHFVVLSIRPAGFADYFQVYHGIQSADGQSMSGTFQVYTGSKTYNFITHRLVYTYTMTPDTYAWSATFASNQQGDIGMGHFWSVGGQGANGVLLEAQIEALSYGWFANQPIIGVFPSTPSSCTACSMYFIRAASPDWTAMEIYQGVGNTAMHGSFVEFSQGSYQNEWIATYQG